MFTQSDKTDQQACDWCGKRIVTIEWTIRKFEVKFREPILSDFLPSTIALCSYCFPRVYNDTSKNINEGISIDNRYRAVFTFFGFFLISLFVFLPSLMNMVQIKDISSEIFFVLFFSILILIPMSFLSSLMIILMFFRVPFGIHSILEQKLMHRGSVVGKKDYTIESGGIVCMLAPTACCILFLSVPMYAFFVLSFITGWGITTKSGGLSISLNDINFLFLSVSMCLLTFVKWKIDQKVFNKSMELAENDPHVNFLDIVPYK